MTMWQKMQRAFLAFYGCAILMYAALALADISGLVDVGCWGVRGEPGYGCPAPSE